MNQLKYSTQEEMDWSNEVNSYYGLYSSKLNMGVIYCSKQMTWMLCVIICKDLKKQIWGEIRSSRTIHMPSYHLPKLEIRKAISSILKSVHIIKI